MTDQPHLLFERDGHVVVVTMNRPEAMNAMSAEMVDGLCDAWDEINSDPNIRVAVLTGAGGRFCAGADLKAMTSRQQRTPGAPRRERGSGVMSDLERKAFLKGFRLNKPLIAAVEGPAVAGGIEILQATDIRVAGESARFGVTEVRWGLFPLAGSTVRLRRQLPYTVAADLLLTGRTITAEKALRIGLIGYVVPDGEALSVAMDLARLIAANGPLAVQAVLRSLRETEGVPEDEAFKIETEIGTPVFRTEDAKEGPKAFAEKRVPTFRGV